MAGGRDYRLTAIFSVRDLGSPIIKAASAKWKGLEKIIESTNFNKLRRQVRQFNRAVKDVGESAVDLGQKVGAPFAALAAGVGFSVQQAVSNFASSGDALDKLSQRLGVSVEEFQRLSYAAESAGASPEALADAFKDLSKHIAEIANGKDTTSDVATLFKKLGIEAKDAAGNVRPVTEVFRELSDAIQRNEDPAIRVRMAMAAMGGSGLALIPMMADGSAGLETMARRADELGIVMSEKDAKAAADLTGALTDMHMVIKAVGNSIGAKLSPLIISISERFTALAAANKDAFSDKVARVAGQFADAIGRIDFEGIASSVLTFADYALRAFNAVGGFNSVLYAMGAVMAGKTVMSVIALGSNLLTLMQTFGKLIPLARAVGIAMAGSLGPVGWVLSGIAVAAGLVISNWDRIWPALKEGASATADFVGAVWERMSSVFGGIIAAMLKTATAFFMGDIKGLLDGLDETIKSVLNILPDAFADAFKGAYEKVKGVVKSIGASIKNALTIETPDFLKGWFDQDASPHHENEVQQATIAPQKVAAQSQLSGRIQVDVRTTEGTAATLADVTSDEGLSIAGSVGQLRPAYGWGTD